MNPFSHNPFDVADRAGLYLAERGIAAAYRRGRLSPVLTRHVPRIVFVLAFAWMAMTGPLEKSATIPLVALIALIAAVRITPDVPSMRVAWNADLYRTYGAVALKEREIRVLRWIIIAVIAAVSTVGAAILTSSSTALTGSLGGFLVMQLSLAFGHWAEAAELPEPDDGDLFARPHSA